MTPNRTGQDNMFFSYDLYQSAALVLLLKIQPEYSHEKSRISFGFPKNDDLFKALVQYNAGALVSASEYANAIKRLKSEMYVRKTMEQTGVFHSTADYQGGAK